MPFYSLRSFVRSLLSRQHRSVRFASAAILVLAAAAPALVHAQCTQSGANWTCGGNVGTTTVNGTSGATIFSFLDDLMGNVTIVSGGGNDTLNFSAMSTGISVNLAFSLSYTLKPGLSVQFQGFNTAGNAYTINGTSGSDSFQGGVGNDTIYGNAGDDEISGGTGNDTIYGGTGGDYVGGEEGNDHLYGEAGKDFISGGAGDDVLSGAKNVDTLNGGEGTDERNDKGSSCIEDTIISIEKDSCKSEEGGEGSETPVEVEAPAPKADQICMTHGTRMDLTDRGMIVIYSDYDNTPNGMIITEIPLVSVRAVTDDEKASNAWVPLLYKDSEFAPGWSVGLYWHENHYGAIVYKDYGKTVVDDTGAICGWF